MTNTNKIILDLINKNASVNEITSITGLSARQLFHRMNMLKIKGYDFKRKYYYNGEIKYSLNKELTEERTNEKTIITEPKDTEFKALVISDLHLCNVNETPELLEEIYDYCAKEGINIILNAGDLIDGCIGYDNQKKISDLESQIDYLLKVYPFDKNILNFICLGNHDYSCMENSGLDLHKIFENKRHDMISLGYGHGIINIKNDQIIINHPNTIKKQESLPINNKLILRGHSHTSKNIISNVNTHIYLPSLSNMKYLQEKRLPSVIKLNISFNKGNFNVGCFEHFVFIDKSMFKVTESQYELFKGKTVFDKIKNEETYESLSLNDINSIIGGKKDEVNENQTNTESIIGNTNTKTLKLSQIEKFKLRYGNK